MTAPGAKLVGGVWLPDTEVHFVDMLVHNKKAHLEIDGKCTYQIRKLRRAMEFVPPTRRRFALDIGAHVGLWAMWMVRDFSFVHCFEPVPAHAEILPHNMGSAKNWKLHRFALGETAGVVDMQQPLETTGNAHVAIEGRHPGTKHVSNPDAKRQFGEIEMRTLDSMALGDVDFIKIDVEGYELPVVVGATETIRRCRPVIVVEQKGNESAYGHEPDAAAKYLMGLGMKKLDCLSGDWILGW